MEHQYKQAHEAYLLVGHCSSMWVRLCYTNTVWKWRLTRSVTDNILAGNVESKMSVRFDDLQDVGSAAYYCFGIPLELYPIISFLSSPIAAPGFRPCKQNIQLLYMQRNCI